MLNQTCGERVIDIRSDIKVVRNRQVIAIGLTAAQCWVEQAGATCIIQGEVEVGQVEHGNTGHLKTGVPAFTITLSRVQGHLLRANGPIIIARLTIGDARLLSFDRFVGVAG